MKYLNIAEDLHTSQLIFGCMRIADMKLNELDDLVQCALGQGINFYDHADIYGGGRSEELFGELFALHPEMRSKMILQTKCSIRRGEIGYFDFSKQHILASVEASLKRLNTNYIDILLLHRPDTLMDPDEVAEAFQELYDSGKVKHFGVSNMNSMQVKYLQKHVKQKLIVNQLQFSPVHSGMITNGLFVNMKESQAVDHDGSILEYCRATGVTIQAWSIMQASWAEGTFLEHPDYIELNECLQTLASKYKVTKSAIVVAWIARHPANMQPIFGTTNAKHLEEMCRGLDVELTREEYYKIYTSAIGQMLP